MKIFAHRGYVINGIKENSIAALVNAVDCGFAAIEFDLYFWQEVGLL